MSDYISIEDKSLILTNHKLFKTAPSEITPECITKLKEIKEILYQYRQDKTNSLDRRQESFDLQQQIHEIIGFKPMDDKFRPKESKGGKSGGWLATPEQRRKNVDAAITHIGKERWGQLKPFEQAQIMASLWGTTKQ